RSRPPSAPLATTNATSGPDAAAWLRFRLRGARQEVAFTYNDLLVVLCALGLLALLVLPALANQRPRSQRVVCANNLRRLGMAFQLWANDHNESFPQELPVADGGTGAHPLAANVWLHFSWISNELSDPKLVFCPSDTGQPAR